MVVTTSFSHVLGDLDLEILDAGGDTLCASSSLVDSEVCEASVFGGQTYFVHVYGFNGATNPAYDLTLDGPDLIADILEPNDAQLEAFYLGMGQQSYADLSIHAANNDDWYRWNSPEDGVVRVAVFYSHEWGDIDLELYDRFGEPLTASASNGDHEELEWEVMTGQEILIRVFGANGTTHRQYELLVEGPVISPDVLEPNDALPDATDLGSADRVIEGLSINSPLDTDWYQWTSPGPGTLQADISFRHDAGDIDMRLYDAGGNWLAESNSTTDNEHISWDVEGDTVYYLQVLGAPLSNILRRPLDRPSPAVFDAVLQREYMLTAHFDPGGIPGDFNLNGRLDAEDIDLLTAADTQELAFDLNSDGVVDVNDRVLWVKELKVTWFGDANLNGEFNSNDLVFVLAAGKYEDGIPQNSGWADGDWNGDMEFDSSDLITALADGGYEMGPLRAVQVVRDATLTRSAVAAAVDTVLLEIRPSRSAESMDLPTLRQYVSKARRLPIELASFRREFVHDSLILQKASEKDNPHTGLSELTGNLAVDLDWIDEDAEIYVSLT